MIKAIFFDLDGTLLTKQKTISPQTKLILEKCKQNEIKLFIATARPPLLAHMLSWDDEILSLFEGGSYYNGGCIITKNIKEYIAVSAELVEKIVAIVAQHESLNVALQLENEKHAFRYPLDTNAYKSWGVSPDKAMSLDSLQELTTVKLLIFFANMIDSVTPLDSELVQLIKNLCEGNSQFYLTDHGKAIQIMGLGVNKFQSIKRICDLYGYSNSEIVVFGDDVNDIEMLSAFDCSVAMGNADEQAKNAAKFITLNNDSDGISYAITNILRLIE